MTTRRIIPLETDMKRTTIGKFAILLLALVPAFLMLVQIGSPHWWSIAVSEDPGISWMIVSDTPEYRVLRDFADAGATRRMHHHADAAWHTFTLATGKLKFTIEGQPSMDVQPGQTLSLKGGVNHTFTNTGSGPATIVEVFGKTNP
jgi:quercetin dioxygenase-like cupin family protein